MAIKFYTTKGEYGFMGNFAKYPMKIYGKKWATVEHAYQAQKTLDEKEYNEILNADTPRKARNLGQDVKLRKDWESVKYSVMKDCVRAKFQQNDDIREQLLATGDEELIEDSPIDWYWGCGKDGKGKNMLGKALMEIRTELRDEKEKSQKDAAI